MLYNMFSWSVVPYDVLQYNIWPRVTCSDPVHAVLKDCLSWPDTQQDILVQLKCDGWVSNGTVKCDGRDINMISIM